MTATPRRTGWTALELMEVEFPAPKWAVEDFIPEGLTILAGKPKIGKSWLLLGLALAVAAGGRALGSIPARAGDVLYLALEDTGRRLQSRLGAILGATRAPERLWLETSWPRSNEGGIGRLDAWVAAHPETRLVMIDTLAKFRPMAKDGAAGYSTDYAAIDPLTELAGRHAVAIVVVHHQRKMATEDWVDSISGTLGLAGAADGMIGLFRERGSQDATMRLTGRDVEDQERGVRWDSVTSGWVLINPAEVGLSPERQAIVDLVREHGPLRPGVIAELLEKNASTTRVLLMKMADRDQIRVMPDGRYATPDGAFTSLTPLPSLPPSTSLTNSLSLLPPPPPGNDIHGVNDPPDSYSAPAPEAFTAHPATVNAPRCAEHPNGRLTQLAAGWWCIGCRGYVQSFWDPGR